MECLFKNILAYVPYVLRFPEYLLKHCYLLALYSQIEDLFKNTLAYLLFAHKFSTCLKHSNLFALGSQIQ
jgi:hypothetical protein